MLFFRRYDWTDQVDCLERNRISFSSTPPPPSTLRTLSGPLPGFRNCLFLRRKGVSPTFNPQTWGLVYLFLSCTSLKIRAVWVALPAAKLPPAWICVHRYKQARLTTIYSPYIRCTCNRGTLHTVLIISLLVIIYWWRNWHGSYIYYKLYSNWYSK